MEKISSYQSEILDFTKRLISIPTENPLGTSYKACVDIIAKKLHEIGLDYTIIDVPDITDRNPFPRYCLLSFNGKGKRTLYFHGHYDVVPAQNDTQFRPYVEDGKLYGRGSSDMKSGLAAMIYAIKAIKESNIELNGRIGLVIVPDEETGGARGSQYLVETGLLGKDGIGMLMPEPTSGMIWNANRGAISLRITVKGKPAHVGLHYQGVNAFERMLVVANALLEVKADIESRKTDFKIEPEAARRSILLIGGRSEGGTNFNITPAECSFTVDRRINPEEDLETEKKSLFDLFDKLRRDGIDLDIEILQEGRSTGFPEDHPVAKTLADSVKLIIGRIPSFEMCPGLLEIRFYAQQGIPSFAYGPGLLSVSHGPNEFVKIKKIYNCATIYALTAAQLLTS
ncbi:M20 family metallopeptidase [Candidatus Borrarchaeum sp.]|uniref:M20 family metallopeptidase n=1 Tax=Candidatus Borrarchaeum sp. TaxID=2846742 RepID=UPI002579D897|nr:M20 family metallopeptidase [Candidatus Borrarchaeum sp.]